MKFVSTTDQENKVKFKLQATGIAVDVGPFKEGDIEHRDMRPDAYVTCSSSNEPIDSSSNLEIELDSGLDAKHDTIEMSPYTTEYHSKV